MYIHSPEFQKSHVGYLPKTSSTPNIIDRIRKEERERTLEDLFREAEEVGAFRSLVIRCREPDNAWSLLNHRRLDHVSTAPHNPQSSLAGMRRSSNRW